MRETNMKVVSAGYEYFGHFRMGGVVVVLEGDGSGCKIRPLEYPNKERDVLNLFRVFELDCENGEKLESLQGKYCRVVFDDELDCVVELKHIVNDGISWTNERYLERKREEDDIEDN